MFVSLFTLFIIDPPYEVLFSYSRLLIRIQNLWWCDVYQHDMFLISFWYLFAMNASPIQRDFRKAKRKNGAYLLYR